MASGRDATSGAGRASKLSWHHRAGEHPMSPPAWPSLISSVRWAGKARRALSALRRPGAAARLREGWLPDRALRVRDGVRGAGGRPCRARRALRRELLRGRLRGGGAGLPRLRGGGAAHAAELRPPPGADRAPGGAGGAPRRGRGPRLLRARGARARLGRARHGALGLRGGARGIERRPRRARRLPFRPARARELHRRHPAGRARAHGRPARLRAAGARVPAARRRARDRDCGPGRALRAARGAALPLLHAPEPPHLLHARHARAAPRRGRLRRPGLLPRRQVGHAAPARLSRLHARPAPGARSPRARRRAQWLRPPRRPREPGRRRAGARPCRRVVRSPMPPSPRLPAIDLVKGCAILCVLFIHSQALGDGPLFLYVVNQAVPIFVVLFGLNSELWWQARSGSEATIASFYASRARRILVPMWAALAVWWTLALLLRPADVVLTRTLPLWHAAGWLAPKVDRLGGTAAALAAAAFAACVAGAEGGFGASRAPYAAALVPLPLTVLLLAAWRLLPRVAGVTPAFEWLGQSSYGVYLGQLLTHNAFVFALGLGLYQRFDLWLYTAALLAGGLFFVWLGESLRRVARGGIALPSPAR